MWQIYLNYHQRMEILPLKNRINCDKCSFATKQRMFGVFAIDEILRYRGTRFPGSRTLCHPVLDVYISRMANSANNHIMTLGNWNWEGPFCLPKTSLKESSTVGILNFCYSFISYNSPMKSTYKPTGMFLTGSNIA